MPKLNLLNELKHIGKTRSIKGYSNMSKERLLSVHSESESAKSFNNAKIEKTKEGFNKLRDKVFKTKNKDVSKRQKVDLPYPKFSPEFNELVSGSKNNRKWSING